MVKSRRLRWRALAILGWALLFITIIIYCPICLAIPTTTTLSTITSLNATKYLSSTSLLASSLSSTYLSSINKMPELKNLFNYSCLTGNTSSSNIIYNISNYNYNISNNNNNINKNLPYNLSNNNLQLKLINQNLNNNNNNQLINITTTLSPSYLLTDDYKNIDYTTIRIKKLNSIYSKRRRKKLLIKNELNNSNSTNNNNNNDSNDNNNSSSDSNLNKKVYRINAETLKILRTYPNSFNNNNNNNNSNVNSTKLDDISTINKNYATTLVPFITTESSTVLQLLLSRTDRSIHQSDVNNGSGIIGNVKRNGNNKRNRLNSNLDRNERSANLSHISGGSARKIQLYIKNRFIQIMPDGTINGTQDDLSDYTILQRTTVDIGQIKIQGVATCLYLCMDQCGTVYGAKIFTDDCVFNESMEQHHYNTYSSTYNSNTRRTLYLALNRRGEPRKLQIPPTRSLGKLATYTKSLTSAVPDERVEKLIAHTFGANRIKHGLRQLCDAGKPLIDLTAKIMKKRPKCQSIPNNLNSASPTTAAVSTAAMALTSEKSRLSSNNSNKNINPNSNSHNNNSTSNINMKKRRKKRRCRSDEPDNETCHRGPSQSIKKKHQNQQKLKCINQNSTETSDCQQRQKKTTTNNNNNKKNQSNGPKQNSNLKKNRQQNGNKNNGNNQVRNINRARNSANSRTTLPSTSRHHHRHMHTSKTTTINPIGLIQTHITTTELNNFNRNDHQYQQDDDDSSIENNNDINDEDLDNDDDDEHSSLPPLVSGQTQKQHQHVGDDTEYDEEFDV